MELFKKKPVDPISERALALNAEIAALEAQIKKLDAQAQRNQFHPKLRSTARPHAGTVLHHEHPEPAAPAQPVAHEPVFEEVDQKQLTARADATSTPEHFNELGVRKYDLLALFKRLQNHFRGPSTMNPKLVNYLAAGGVQGLRPMRYEKRVARNRFIVFAIILFLVLVGIISVFVRNHH
jgi:hypothetical protein